MLSLVVFGFSAAAADAHYYGVPTPGNPLAGHPWFVDRERGAWWVTLRADPAQAGPLRAAANYPMSKTFGSFDTHPEADVHNYIRRAVREEPGSIPLINLARIEGQSCPYRPTPREFSERAVDKWVARFSAGIGRHRVLVILETDKLAVIGCLPRWAQRRRYRELRYEVRRLHRRNPRAIVYIDAGSENWGKTPAEMAARLRRADVAQAHGFSLGASHHDWTWKEDEFGLKISRLLRGKHFVVNTDSNGWGPKPHAPTAYSAFYHGGCTPPGEGLGIRPTVYTPSRLIDAYLWLGTPGYEDGDCLGQGSGAPYTFYVQEAISLVRFANPPLG